MNGYTGVKIKRPIIWITLAYIAGILLAGKLNFNNLPLWIVTALLLCFVLYCCWRWKNFFYLLFLIAMLLGIANSMVRYRAPNPLDRFTGEAVLAYGQIAELSLNQDNKDVYILKLQRIRINDNYYNVKAVIRLTVYPDKDNKAERQIYNLGDWVEIAGEIKEPQGQRNPGCFDYKSYLDRQGIHKIMGVYSSDIKFIKIGRLTFLSHTMGISRGFAGKIFDEKVGGREGSLLKAMLLGEKQNLSPALQDEFSQTGLSHILAISGLHVGFIVVIISKLLELLKISRRKAFIFQTVILVVYCILVGASASVVRATIMAIVLLGGRIIGRRTDSLNTVFLAAFAILIFKPLELFEIGFQLSFAAVMGIIFQVDVLKDLVRFLPSPLIPSISISLSAQLGVLPILAYYFNIFTPISLLANLVLIPITGIAVMGGFLLLPVSIIIPPLGSLMGWMLKLVCAILTWGNSLFSSFPYAYIKVVSPGILLIIGFYFILWIWSRERPRIIKNPLIWSSVIVFVLLFISIVKPLITQNHLKVVFLDVGQGDCIYIRTPDRRHILIDGGGTAIDYESDFDVGEDVVVPFLLKNGVKRLDMVIMSHGHDDHIGGLLSVVRSIQVGAFMEYPPGEKSKKYNELKELISKKRIPVIKGKAGQSFKVGEKLRIDVYYPEGNGKDKYEIYQNNENNLSLVLKVSYQNGSLLLTGDVESEVEEYLTSRWQGSVDILKVSHHGSSTSSTLKWIECLSPKLCVIQVGNNLFGHPSPSTLDNLQRTRAAVLRNDNNGAIICSFKDKKWTVRWMVGNGSEKTYLIER